MAWPSLENKQKIGVHSERKVSRKPKEEKVSRHFPEIKKKQHPQLADAKK